MPSITFDRFEGGLDVRRGPSVSDGNRLRSLKNAYINTGRGIQKRPCLRKIYSLEPGTTGLRAAGGKLHTFYESGSITHSNALFQANKVAHPATSQPLAKVHYADLFLGFLYVAVEYLDGSIAHHYLDGASPTHIADVNCPNTAGIIKAANKIWAINGDTVRFCAAGLPRDWTTASDAGFIPVGRTQSGSSDSLALGTFQNQLVVFFEDGAQLWDVDEDPALNSLKHLVYGVGTRHPKSPASFSSDVFFLSAVGFRSITISTQSVDNFIDVDIGSPIDSLVRPLLAASSDARGLYVPAFGQYWGFIGNTAWVYTYSRSAKLASWSEYEFPVTVDDVCALSDKVYIRSGEQVFEVTSEVFTDDGTAVSVEATMAYLDCKEPGNLKQFWGADFVGAGTPMMAFKYDPNTPAFETEEYEYTGDTRTGVMHGVDVSATNIAPVLRHSANEDFRLDALTLYFHSLGAV